jgi:adenylate cyclase
MRTALERLRSPRVAPAALTLGTVVALVALFVAGAPFLDHVELRTYDLRFLARGAREPLPVVAMAAIDEKSLGREGRWPWPRSKLAALIDALSRDGAKVIAFDIAFSEPDENSQLALLDRLGRELDGLPITDRRLVGFLARARESADNDAALAAAIENSRAAIVLGYFFHRTEASLGYRLEPSELEQRLKRLERSRYPMVVSTAPDLASVPAIKAYAPETNLEAFTSAASSSGYFSLRSDPDGVLRSMPLVVQAGEDLFPPLAMLAAWHYLDRPRLAVRVGRHGVEGVQLGNRFIPTDESGQVLINYLGPPRTFPQYSITDILAGTTPPGTFKDRIVLVGATAVGMHDLRSTPFSPVYAGLEIHASVVDNLLTGAVMARPEWARIHDVLAIVALGALAGAMLPRLGPLWGLVFMIAVSLAYLAVARGLFVHARLWLNVVYPLLALSVTYTALTAYHYVTEQRERRRIKGAFRQYVAPLVVEEILKEPSRLTLGGEEKVLTVLFSDLEGFTTYSERYSPGEMVEILSEYYNRMTEHIFLQRGTLKEYVGDELMAIFGAPLEQPDHAERACAAALAMRAERIALAREWTRSGRPRLRARTGINSGAMLVGNLGSKYRFAYGVLGDQVNLGSRLEGLNKLYGTEILVGETTARLVARSFLLREVDTVRVAGKHQSVRLYELLDTIGAALPLEQDKALRAYAAGLEAYRQRKWDDGLALFAAAMTSWPEDGPAPILAARCRAFLQAPPPDDWDGVYEQTSKA